MPDEFSNPYARLWHRIAFPEEAITTVKILEELDVELYKVALPGGREAYAASAGRDEQFDVGKDEKVYLEFYSTKFRPITPPKDPSGLGIWPESSSDGTVRRYRYAGRILGMYDWSATGESGGISSIRFVALLDVGFPLTFSFEFNLRETEKTYLGFSDYVGGEGFFEIMHAGYLQDRAYFLKTPPWQRRPIDIVFIKDDADWFRPPMPSKAERKEIRKKARASAGESADRSLKQTSRTRKRFWSRKEA
jgi:hypothetical protein